MDEGLDEGVHEGVDTYVVDEGACEVPYLVDEGLGK